MSLGRLFIVDDNPNNLTLLAGILREAGYDVRAANSGRRALKAIESEPPELVLLDVSMPDLDGYEVCAALRELPQAREVPVIFLSALDDVRDKLLAFKAGGVDYVTKPFQSEEVLARVATQLKLSRLRAELAERNTQLTALNQELERSFRDVDRLFSALTMLLPGSELDGRFRLEEQIGVGGFAVVYRARHLASGRDVALKLLRPERGLGRESNNERFLREGVLAVRVGHPNAVEVLESGVTRAGLPYLAMELLRGRTLAQELTDGPLSLQRCAQVMAPVCRALRAAHEGGVVHRDVKPANIFLHEREGQEVVKVVDFGISRSDDLAQGSLTTTGRLLGTPAYMAPERLLGKGDDGRADVYAVAATIYEALSGKLPHGTPESIGALIVARASQTPIALIEHAPHLPESLCATVMRALSLRPSERPTLAELEQALLGGRLAGTDAPAREEPSPLLTQETR